MGMFGSIGPFSLSSVAAVRLLLSLSHSPNVLPYVSPVLTEAEHLLDRTESTGVIPRPNENCSALTLYKAVMPLPIDGHLTDCHSYSNQFLRIRMESHRAPGILRQLRLAAQYGQTCKLYTLSSRVVATKVEIKVC